MALPTPTHPPSLQNIPSHGQVALLSSLCCYPLFFVGLLRSQPLICILSYFSNPFSGSAKVEVHLAFLPLPVEGT
ncbi:hypothetical protein E2C01_039233 [Portunus trituberculatus]|uniref:Uncharacterized protein n=1 Tax=Portunus trituberculatus TaxID=210409 RepID=A0A5B7FE84_PORTR|nr:hypothetical protein [Portunus trituberculatus]